MYYCQHCCLCFAAVVLIKTYAHAAYLKLKLQYCYNCCVASIVFTALEFKNVNKLKKSMRELVLHKIKILKTQCTIASIVAYALPLLSLL